jgi:hypothetical protein
MNNSDTVTIVLIVVLLFFLFIYFLLTSAFFRSSTKAVTITIPRATVTKAYHMSKRNKKEVAQKYDFENPNAAHPEHVHLQQVTTRTGSNNSVMPLTTPDDEVLLHTHPVAKVKNPILAVYANQLRERPSEADLQALAHSPRSSDILVTPSGHTFVITKSPGASASGLDDYDRHLQHHYATRIENSADAQAKAQVINHKWVAQAEQQGFTIREVRSSEDIKLKTKIR